MVMHFSGFCRVVRLPLRTSSLSAMVLAGVLCAGVTGFGPFSTKPVQASEWNTSLQMHGQERATLARGEATGTENARARFGIGRRPLGRAPYVCTPSGFGRTATCYLRGSARSSLN